MVFHIAPRKQIGNRNLRGHAGGGKHTNAANLFLKFVMLSMFSTPFSIKALRQQPFPTMLKPNFSFDSI